MVEAIPISGRRRSAAIKAEYNRELDEATANNWRPECHDRPEDFALYEQRPTISEAEALCAPCPMSKGDNLCALYAEVTRAGWGIWGGQIFVDGKAIKRRGRKPYRNITSNGVQVA